MNDGKVNTVQVATPDWSWDAIINNIDAATAAYVGAAIIVIFGLSVLWKITKGYAARRNAE